MVWLVGERIVLREWRRDEVEAMHRWFGNPQVTRFLTWGGRTLTDTERHLAACLEAQRAADRRRYFLALELRESGRAIGDAGFEWIAVADAEREGRFGVFLEPSYWGCGYATEAAGLLLDFAFGELAASVMRASCDAGNVASERVLQRCGMQREPARESPGRRAYRIARSEWQEREASRMGRRPLSAAPGRPRTPS